MQTPSSQRTDPTKLVMRVLTMHGMCARIPSTDCLAFEVPLWSGGEFFRVQPLSIDMDKFTTVRASARITASLVACRKSCSAGCNRPTSSSRVSCAARKASFTWLLSLCSFMSCAVVKKKSVAM